MALEPPWTPASRQWLKDQLARGCSRREIADILFQQGFTLATVREKMGADYPPEIVHTQAPLEPPPILRKPPKTLRKIDTDKLDLYVLEDFLSARLCDQVMALLKHHLLASPVPGRPYDTEYRNNRTCFLGDLKSPVAQSVIQRICKTIGINPTYAENTHAQHYDAGQQFKAHRDYFDFKSAYHQDRPESGNRTWTFMVYLNEGMGGGGTKFHAIDQTFEPRKGRALFWNSLYPNRQPNPDTVHSGELVTSGSKMIITQWFREYGPGPMFLE